MEGIFGEKTIRPIGELCCAVIIVVALAAACAGVLAL